MPSVQRRRRARGSIRAGGSGGQDVGWASKALHTILRQAAVALLVFGLACFGMLGSQPARPLIERLVSYASATHHTYDDVVGWVIQLREAGLPVSWPRAQEVWLRLWQRAPEGGAQGGPDGTPAWSLIWPVKGQITSGFGWRTHPIYNDIRYHTGVDIAAEPGTPVVAARSGIVAETGSHEVWGNFVLLEHDADTASFYAHLDTIAVSKGAKLDRGQTLGAVGKTGQASNPHLHFELREKGEPVDPEPLLRAAGG
jgi:murein DD-endopeptidase MepM/ murein hydrolase activator NlpD